MKKRSVCLILVMVLLCIATPALSGNAVNGTTYRVNITMPAGHDHIYLYDQPSSSNGRNLGRINNGEYVIGISSVERKGYTWIYCNYNGIEGYIRKNNLVKISGGSSSSSSSGGGSSSSNSSGGGNVTFSGNVNVRTGPGLDYSKMGSINKGQTLSYAGDTSYDNRGVAWYSVYFNGSKGWVSSKYASVRGGNSSGKSHSGSGKSSTPSNAGNDGQSVLRKRLNNNIGGNSILHFGYSDYDGDGNYEAFAIVGNSDWNDDNIGELWFVSGNTVKVLERNKGYYPDESEITKLKKRNCYRLSEGYWGSGGYYRYWTVSNGSPYLYCEQEVWFSQGTITGETYHNVP